MDALLVWDGMAYVSRWEGVVVLCCTGTWCVVPVVAVQPGAQGSSAPAGTVLYGTCSIAFLCHSTKYQLGCQNFWHTAVRCRKNLCYPLI